MPKFGIRYLSAKSSGCMMRRLVPLSSSYWRDENW